MKNLYETKPLTEMERRVIKYVAAGDRNIDVAMKLGTTDYVIKNYLRVIYDKLGMWNRLELALWYERRRHEARVQAAGGSHRSAQSQPHHLAVR